MNSHVLVALMVSAMVMACGEETPSQQSTIIVTSASYGRNCAPLATGNATNSVKVACDGKPT